MEDCHTPNSRSPPRLHPATPPLPLLLCQATAAGLHQCLQLVLAHLLATPGSLLAAPVP